MTAEHELGRIASELKRIRLALERLAPPPPEEDKTRKAAPRRVWCL
jgi:hypothetical protein